MAPEVVMSISYLTSRSPGKFTLFHKSFEPGRDLKLIREVTEAAFIGINTYIHIQSQGSS